eukprot:534124_1
MHQSLFQEYCIRNKMHQMDFFTLDGVVTLFQRSNPEGILAAWIHYVIFDMWTAWWIATDYQDNIEHSYGTKAYELTSLFLTMMLGPIGLATYLIGKYTFLPPVGEWNKQKPV